MNAPIYTFSGWLRPLSPGGSQFSVTDCLSGQFGRFNYAQGDCPGLLDTDVVVGSQRFATHADLLQAINQANAMNPPGAIRVTWQQGPRFAGRLLNTVISAVPVSPTGSAAAPPPARVPSPAPTIVLPPSPVPATLSMRPEDVTARFNQCLAQQGILRNVSAEVLRGCGFAAMLGGSIGAALESPPQLGAALGLGTCISAMTGLNIGLVTGCLLRSLGVQFLPGGYQVPPSYSGPLGRPGYPF